VVSQVAWTPGGRSRKGGMLIAAKVSGADVIARNRVGAQWPT
jgi:hypothetical protein